MYSVAIVDDERMTRESISSHIDWTKLQMHIAFTATDGIDALHKFAEHPIDILITDIRMPHMNGIELAMHVRAKHPACKILFLSGYTDKEYLKSAITLKVEQYIEKPIDIAELTAALQAIGAHLAAEHMHQITSPLFPTALVQASRLVKQEIAKELVLPANGGYHYVHSRYYPLYFDWKEQDTYQVFCIYAHASMPILDELYVCTEELEADGLVSDFMATNVNNHGIALITHQTIDPTFPKTLHEKIQKLGEQGISVGYSHPITSIHSIPESWDRAQTQCSMWFYVGKASLLGPDVNLQMTEFLVEQALPALNFSCVQAMFCTLFENPPKDLKAARKYLYALYLKMMELTINDNRMNFSDFAEYSLMELRELILYGMHVFGTLGSDTYDPKIKDAIHYILWHYTDKNLSIKVLAEHTGLSQNYLCSLFKQHTGTTINNVLIDVRIEKTKKLLRTTDLKMYEITQKVGMADPNYLSSLFKSHVGVTPSQYRDYEVKGLPYA
ncbi:response regulator [Sphaerochaeta globosa]|uniref:Two component transcriptional regulator, AraC family n=1 Tax=Sphaerochaeta globosa (strain ATCC BAA-1886 / DSM 22777 / Buddy) TaxID=158189 RepID=F0RU90_SPHGB|nr:response regulator [Sphaerochaeta globosa]ADY12176.1 two component transcriptional regulator, AraC family [Sphaerochaeta globosa str. Buddy]